MMARLLVWAGLLATCNAAGLAPSCKLFKSCRQGETVDIPSVVAATDEYLKFLDSFGKWTAASIGETRSCLQKVEDGVKQLRSSGIGAFHGLSTITVWPSPPIARMNVVLHHADPCALWAC